MALGPAAGVVDVEVDNPARAAPLLERVSPAATLGWRSARGDHRVYAWDERLGRLTDKAVVYLLGGAVELRIGGTGKQLVAVCPPTVGTTRRRRLWNGVWEVAPFPERLLAEIERMQGEKIACRERPHSAATASSPYAAAALRREAELVRTAQPGTRNRTLNRAAFNLGQLVAGGLVERGAVEVELAIAAADAGLPEREVAATVRSGLDAGTKNPRTRRPPAG